MDMNPNPKILIKVNVSQQQMQIWLNDKLTFYYPISTALLGLGEEKESFKTPRGKHIIRAKIGKGSPIHSVFVKRRETGEIYSDSLALAFPERDWILTRILWLSGLEKGKNRLGNCDTMQRYIYIHGTHDESNIGTPKSRGCIRMRNQDIVELFELVPIGTPVFIE